MPKNLFTTVFFLFFLSAGQTQSLAGIWEGHLFVKNKRDTLYMKLQFIWNADSTYSAYSFSREKKMKTVCRMSFEWKSKNEIYLEETGVIRTTYTEPMHPLQLQAFFLTVDDDFKTMSGNWNFPHIKNFGKKRDRPVKFTKIE
ncbi:MAG: hypothetical protein KIT80_13720 [Chitinophagaceae bacterium]|nr:hypothetical protein [Chitinophagaceae bacterium]MCW5927968.1 hypothetical protein [Chitinophagaceae bacterium]